MITTPKELLLARKKNLTFYFTGKPCPKGHIANRYTKSSKCVICVSERSKKYGPEWFQKNKIRLRKIRKKHAENNRDKYVEYQKKYRDKNPENYKKTLDKSKEWRKKYSSNYWKKNKSQLLEKKYKKLKEDFQYRLKEIIRSRIQSGLKQHAKNHKKSMRTIMYLGCTYKEYINYLEKKFKKGMNWSNMGGNNGWQIDHIIPLSNFDLSKKKNQLMAFNFKNTQPLWKKENLVKSNKLK